jgi:hypothetical protein
LNRRRTILLLALLVVAAAVARKARNEPSASPTLDAPGQATPEEQAETNREVAADWTPEDIDEALANPRMSPPRSS